MATTRSAPERAAPGSLRRTSWRAGGGDDTLNGSTSTNGFVSMSAGPGDDDLLGGPSGDSLFGDLGADLLQGGDGFDFISWGGTAGVNVTVGSGANDGEPGEGDDVRADIEFFSGTSFNDVFIGTAGAQQFFGGAGSD